MEHDPIDTMNDVVVRAAKTAEVAEDAQLFNSPMIVEMIYDIGALSNLDMMEDVRPLGNHGGVMTIETTVTNEKDHGYVPVNFR